MVKFHMAPAWAPVFISLGMVMTYQLAYAPESLLFGKYLQALVDYCKTQPTLFPNIFNVACVLHVLEALYVCVRAVRNGSSARGMLNEGGKMLQKNEQNINRCALVDGADAVVRVPINVSVPQHTQQGEEGMSGYSFCRGEKGRLVMLLLICY